MIKLDDKGAIPLGNEPIYFNNEIVGKTTSASFGYRIGAPLALGDIFKKNEEILNEGVRVSIDIGRDFFEGTVFLKSLFDPLGLRMRKI